MKINFTSDMDKVTQIKQDLIARITNSGDIDFLKAIQTIFESAESKVFVLSTAQKTSIEAGRKDIENGDVFTNDEVMAEMKGWLNEK